MFDVSFYMRVFADFWEVFGTVVYFYVHEVVADQPNAVCLLFVCKIDRWKPVKYDRLCWLCLRIYAQQLIRALPLDSIGGLQSHRAPYVAPLKNYWIRFCFHARHSHARIHLHRCFAPLAVWTYGNSVAAVRWLKHHSPFRTIAVPHKVLRANGTCCRGFWRTTLTDVAVQQRKQCYWPLAIRRSSLSVQ